jgi:hypothetical protein
MPKLKRTRQFSGGAVIVVRANKFAAMLEASIVAAPPGEHPCTKNERTIILGL